MVFEFLLNYHFIYVDGEDISTIKREFVNRVSTYLGPILVKSCRILFSEELEL